MRTMVKQLLVLLEFSRVTFVVISLCVLIEQTQIQVVFIGLLKFCTRNVNLQLVFLFDYWNCELPDCVCKRSRYPACIVNVKYCRQNCIRRLKSSLRWTEYGLVCSEYVLLTICVGFLERTRGLGVE